jgi:Uma2 family endonuclease
VTSQLRYTSADLESMPDDGKRYEIIDGELYVSRQPDYRHQRVCARFVYLLAAWDDQADKGEVSVAPGLIFAEDDDVAPDVVWVSIARRTIALSKDGKLHAAPELVIEVLSPGSADRHRDREAKLKLYSRRGVEEYWIADWQLRIIEVYRRKHAQLELMATLHEGDILDSPILPGFSCTVERVFAAIPPEN